MHALMENGGPLESCPEDHEQIELLTALDEAVASARGPVYVLDIHTTSGGGGAFTTAGDTLRNREFALSLEVPFVLGLEELVDGTMLEYMGRRGFIAALFEGGQHDEPAAVDRVEAAVWIALESAGLIPEEVVPQVSRGRQRLSREVIGQPPVLEMRYKYDIEPGSRFLMKPGFENFKPVKGGEVIGSNGGGEVRSPEAGRILMPLYQEQGDDGFFIVRSFHPIWLMISSLLRHLHVDRIVHWLPGLGRHPSRPGTLVANKHVARWYALEVLHLLGYRKKTEEGDRLVVDRRGEYSTQ
jgi:succinylglutamate desuccinylase